MNWYLKAQQIALTLVRFEKVYVTIREKINEKNDQRICFLRLLLGACTTVPSQVPIHIEPSLLERPLDLQELKGRKTEELPAAKSSPQSQTFE
ncbi:hypothetical protein [Methylophilus methylotrophus]|uniref:hypothetical protein n=1 Tax=Methylophilus methylotrophus TaxID=17 RepID=UPI000F59FF5D|nr:hypothetical protein [Methylophilus methylotrophus]